ncbi:MAG: DegT/DnrJ/EryC1/StrS family aminotransferase, partial [Thermotogaceae bacterium]|nr:DegT/DnrJ/EryC1/StrS family aminotransferase [Thermotogaceae bacterium]
ASWMGGYPAFVDVEKDSMNMDLDNLNNLLSGAEGGINPERVKTIVFVHLFGRSLDLDRLENIRGEYKIPIVEDVAQALGAEWKKKDGSIVKAGTVSDIATFSFFPTKNLGTYGDGGAVATNNEELCEILRMLRTHGSKKKYNHEILGKNARLDEIHAAVLRVKLRYIDEWNDRRIEIAKLYGKLFEDMELTGFLEYPEPVEGFRGHVFHQYVVRFKKPEYREKVIEKFKERGIGFAIYYPKPLHLQPVFEYLGFSEGDFPVAENLSKTTLALPIFPELRDDEVEFVALTIKKALEV